jgi:hypothetical protein
MHRQKRVEQVRQVAGGRICLIEILYLAGVRIERTLSAEATKPELKLNIQLAVARGGKLRKKLPRIYL